MAFKKVHYTISNSHPKLVVTNYFSTTAAQNARTFQVLSRTYPVFKHFQGPWISKTEFKHFQGFFEHCMNPFVKWHTVTDQLLTDSLISPILSSRRPSPRRLFVVSGCSAIDPLLSSSPVFSPKPSAHQGMLLDEFLSAYQQVTPKTEQA